MKPTTPAAASFRVLAIYLFTFLAFAALHARAADGTDGLYADPSNNYRIEVKFVPGKLIVVEPNKTSEYIQRPNTGIFDFTNPTNGIAYILEVASEKLLKAYKPGSPGDVTPLALVRAATPAEKKTVGAGKKQSKRAKVVRVKVQNKNALNPDMEELWGAHQILEGNVTILGRYVPEGETMPYLELAAGGKGTFQMHGAPNPEHVYGINWWIQANQDGTLVQTQHPGGVQYMLIVEYDRPYQGDKFDRLSLAVAKDGRIQVLDRVKRK